MRITVPIIILVLFLQSASSPGNYNGVEELIFPPISIIILSTRSVQRHPETQHGPTTRTAGVGRSTHARQAPHIGSRRVQTRPWRRWARHPIAVKDVRFPQTGVR